jgi:acyl-CoA dehydrogenase
MLNATTDTNLHIPVKSEEYVDICDTVQKVCEKFPGKYWRELENKPTGQNFPDEFFRALAESGMHGAIVPEEHGGIELPVVAVVAILERIHALGCNASALISQFELTDVINHSATEQVQASLLPQLAVGAATIFAYADGAPGSDRIPISARVVDGSVELNGSSERVLAPHHSDFMLVSAVEGSGVSLFLVDLAQARGSGLTISPVQELTASNVAEVSFERLRVPGDNRIGKPGLGAAILDRATDLRRILEAAAAIGDGRFFSRRGAQYAVDRVVFGHPIGSYQGIQFPLARAHIEVEAASVGLQKAVALFDACMDATTAASVARYLAMEAAWNMAEAAFTTHGGFAFAREYDIERKWRDVRAAKLGSATSQSDLKTIGAKHLFNSSAPAGSAP